MLLFHVFLQIQQTCKTTINHHFCGHFRLPINTLRWKQIELKKHAVYDLCVNIHFSSGTVSACQLSQAPMLSGYRQPPTLGNELKLVNIFVFDALPIRQLGMLYQQVD
jgi:hypothetical protein